MIRIDTVRGQLTELVRAHPFHPFIIGLENGDRITVEHPENVAFDSKENGLNRLFIIAERLVHNTTLSAVSNISELDRGQAAA